MWNRSHRLGSGPGPGSLPGFLTATQVTFLLVGALVLSCLLSLSTICRVSNSYRCSYSVIDNSEVEDSKEGSEKEEEVGNLSLC